MAFQDICTLLKIKMRPSFMSYKINTFCRLYALFSWLLDFFPPVTVLHFNPAIFRDLRLVLPHSKIFPFLDKIWILCPSDFFFNKRLKPWKRYSAVREHLHWLPEWYPTENLLGEILSFRNKTVCDAMEYWTLHKGQWHLVVSSYSFGNVPVHPLPGHNTSAER